MSYGIFDHFFWNKTDTAQNGLPLHCERQPRVDNAFKQATLKNGVGQYPSLVSVTEDPRKRHGKRYTIRNVGISIKDMKSKIDSHSQELGVIYEISETPKPRYTYLYVLPGKSILPTHTPIVYDNDF